MHLLQFNSRDVLLVALLISSVSNVVSFGKSIDRDEFMETLEGRLETLSVPPPEMIDEFMSQIEGTCRGNNTTDLMEALNKTSNCMDNLFNGTDIMAEIREAVPKGDLDVVFHKICLRWPKMKKCMDSGLNGIGECWGQRVSDQLTRAMDAVVNFFCRKDNDGALAALFIAEEGLKCLEDFGNNIGTCFTDQVSDLEELPASICTVLGYVYNCLPIMKRCSNVTPENLMSALTVEVGRVMGCQTFNKTKILLSDNAPGNYGTNEKDVQLQATKFLDPSDLLGILKNFKSFKAIVEVFANHCENSAIPHDEITKVIEASIENPLCQDLQILPNSLPEIQHGSITGLDSTVKGICSNILNGQDCYHGSLNVVKGCSPNGFVGLTLVLEFCKDEDLSNSAAEAMTLQCQDASKLSTLFYKCINLHLPQANAQGPIQEDIPHFFSTENFNNHFCRTLSLTRQCLLVALGHQTSCIQNHFLHHRVRRFLTRVESRDDHIKACLHSQGSVNVQLNKSSSLPASESSFLMLGIFLSRFLYEAA